MDRERRSGEGRREETDRREEADRPVETDRRLETEHAVVGEDARSMDALEDGSVELVVTSPPYPMIEMWDGTFSLLDPEVEARLDAGDAWGAFERMHAELDAAWDEVARVLAPGGVACVNVGDATRTVDGEFACFPNHARVLSALADRGLTPLPGVLWRKPTNAAAKFMGSGTLPPNAYVTLEHEHVLVVRKGGPRSFEPGATERYESAFFWEERNEWFSDVWTDVAGERQAIEGDGPRERAGAFPFEVPFRLINMYSTYGDTVCDPFWGTGTTSVAAMAAARDSVGFEIEPELVEAFEERARTVPELSRSVQAERLRSHLAFVQERREAGEEPGHEAERYGFPVVTRQEREVCLYAVSDLTVGEERYSATHAPVDPPGAGG